MNQAPLEITLDELPAYGQEVLKSRRSIQRRKTGKTGNQRALPQNRMLIIKADDGTILYYSIGGVLAKASVWITKTKVIDVYYQPSICVRTNDDVRRIATLIGLKAFADAVVREDYTLNDELVEALFEQDKAVFFVSKDKRRLLASAFETDQQQYGPLQQFTSISTFREYGISLMYEAVERGIAIIDG